MTAHGEQSVGTVILGAARTPFGRLGGALSGLDATELGGRAIAAALDRSNVPAAAVDDVVFGQVLQAGQGQIPSRQAQIRGGIPKTVRSETINKVCASGMRSLAIADMAIRAGGTSVAVAGGMESMSNAPHMIRGVRFGTRVEALPVIDALTYDGLTSPFSGKSMIAEADRVAARLEISRVDMDRFAARSQQRAAEAARAGRLSDEIVVMSDCTAGTEGPLEHDEAIREDTTLEMLTRLRPIGDAGATHTAGNSPSVNDGACAIMAASSAWAEREGREPLARLLTYGAVAGDFDSLAYMPAGAARAALAKARITPGDVDLWEINEAFASVVLNSVRLLGIDEDRVNVNGGAIALGHPIGASGARIVATLIYELRRRGGGLGCAAICSGGGQGDAVLLEVYGG